MSHQWKISATACGHKTCDNYSKTSEEIFAVIDLLQRNFHVQYNPESLKLGLDSVGFPIAIDNESFIIGWDVWSGIFVMSVTDTGDKLIDKIQIILNEHME